MSHPNKVKGTRWESEVVDYLAANGFPSIERRSLKGNKDQGDIANVADWVLECKNEKTIGLGGYMDEGATELTNAQDYWRALIKTTETPPRPSWFAAIVKRRRKNVSAAYVVMPLSQFVRLIQSNKTTQQIMGGR